MVFATGAGSALPAPDPHGQAALLLVESLMHVLVEAGVLTIRQAVDAAVTAAEVKDDIADAGGEPKVLAELSRMLLVNIAASLNVKTLR
jgi:hypothetical protein